MSVCAHMHVYAYARVYVCICVQCMRVYTYMCMYVYTFIRIGCSNPPIHNDGLENSAFDGKNLFAKSMLSMVADTPWPQSRLPKLHRW